MRWRGVALATLAMACAHPRPVGGPSGGPRPAAIASGTLRTRTGERVGVAAVTDSMGMLRLALSVGDLSPGLHSVRIETAAGCGRPDRAAAASTPPATVAESSAVGDQGDRRRESGLLNQPAPPLGELSDLLAKPDGSADTSFALPRDLPATGPGSLLDAEGTSVVIGAGPSVHPDSADTVLGQVACTVLRPG